MTIASNQTANIIRTDRGLTIRATHTLGEGTHADTFSDVIYLLKTEYSSKLRRDKFNLF